jgi:hypothetical protein
MTLYEPLVHHLRYGFEALSERPTDWAFIFFIPVILVMFGCRHEKAPGRLKSLIKPLVVAGSAAILIITIHMAVFYMSMNFIDNSYATLFAMTSWLFHLGMPVYSDAAVPAPYSMPYGPYAYMLVSYCQQAFGPSIYASKMAPFLATLGSTIFLYLALRSRLAWPGALALTALANAMLAPFEPLQYWPRPDPFLLLAVSGGLWASTRKGWAIGLGFFIGLSINLKIYSIVYFFLPLACVWRRDKSVGSWTLAGLTTVLIAALPFAMPNISIVDYLRIVEMDSHTSFRDYSAMQYFEWCILLSMIGFSPLFIHLWTTNETMASLRRNCDLWCSLVLSLVLLGYPCCKIDPHHLMPCVLVVTFLAACLFADISSRPFLDRSPHLIPFSMVLSVAVFTGLNVAVQDISQVKQSKPKELLAVEQIQDIVQIYRAKMPCILLNASGDVGRTQDPYFYRSILVFNGMPEGIDTTASMDYKAFSGREPNLDAVVEEIRSTYHRPIVWICAKNTIPFSLTSYFTPQGPVFSDKFLNDFHREFKLSGHSACFDLYEQTPN